MISEGETVPKFSVNDANGNKVKSTDFKGKNMPSIFTQKISLQDVLQKQMNSQKIIKNFKKKRSKLLESVQTM